MRDSLMCVRARTRARARILIVQYMCREVTLIETKIYSSIIQVSEERQMCFYHQFLCFLYFIVQDAFVYYHSIFLLLLSLLLVLLLVLCRTVARLATV